MEKDLFKLLETIEIYNSNLNKELINKAYFFAKKAHSGQKRLSGDDYFTHPLNVAIILASWKLDTKSIVAGLLHDTVEDTSISRQNIVDNFGEDVAVLVDGVTKVTNLRLRGSVQKDFVENLRKMLIAMSKDLRVILIKLADRLHNMRTVEYLSVEKQKENSIETLEIYAPLSDRLGMGKVKGELEDISFKFAYPDDYLRLKKMSDKYYKNAELHILKITNSIKKELDKIGKKYEIHTRKKHLYSLWRKLLRPENDWNFDKIYDIVAVRILVSDNGMCYEALGIVHSIFKPVPYLGISDFVAQPKPNGYRSIHTRVFGPAGRIVEFQIRTFEMHLQAEYGDSAHWAYSEAKSSSKLSDKVLESGIRFSDKKISLVKQLIEWQNEIVDSDEFTKSMKVDLFGQRNFVFSPNGDVYDLPNGATPIDFAFAVHTKLANSMIGAKVNGKMVPLDYKLQSGQVVEILKSKNNKKLNSKWLDIAVTSQAKREIKKQLAV